MITLTDNPWVTFLLGTLATYRLSLMISKESGPARLLRKLRHSAPPKSATREGLSCQLCLAIHFGALVAGWYWWRDIITGMDFPIWWLAMSGAAICVHMKFTTSIGGKE